jgi:hypothetical protein
MKRIAIGLVMLFGTLCASAQQSTTNSNEKRVPLTETAAALDANAAPAIEATLSTTGINGTPDAPVTNIRMIVRNTSPISYAFVSGIVTFYDAAGVRCGEAIFKADALAVNESFEADAPGIRIRCSPASWRIVATSLLPRSVPNPTATPVIRSSSRLVISVDGELHPIQLDKPMMINVGDKQLTIIIREGP